MPYQIALLIILFLVPLVTFASETNGTIMGGGDAGHAWSDQTGWVSFVTDSSNVAITDSGITGYAWSANYGWINLAPASGGVAVAADGSLSGHAWGESLGWIDFSGVSINASGVFVGQATGDVIGILTFDCDYCSVTTDYRPQNARDDTDTGSSGSSGGGRAGGPADEDEEPTAEDVSFDEIELVTPAGPPAPPATDGVGPTPDGAAASENEQSGVTAEPGTALPEQLFDISLRLDEEMVADAVDLVARLNFESFGTKPTPVAITFIVLDANGNTVYRADGDEIDIIVETENVYTQRFPDLTLPDGEYTLVAETLYNDDVFDTFTVSFSVGYSQRWWDSGVSLGAGIVGVVVLLICLFLLLLFKRRKTKEETEGVLLQERERK